MIQQPIIVCHRDPDSSNEYRTFDQDGVNPIVVTLDYGADNLDDADMFKVWAQSQLVIASKLLDRDTPNAIAAAMHLIGAVSDAAANNGHSWPAS